MKTKLFDCVEMKRKGAEALKEKLEGMTLEEEVIYWQSRLNELRERQKTLRDERKVA